MHQKKLLLAATLLATGLSACASGPGESQSAGGYFQDSGITTRVKTAFIRDPDIHSMNIHVLTMNNKVQLTGEAGTQKEIDRAVELASAVSGVEGVKNDIQLRERDKEAASDMPKP